MLKRSGLYPLAAMLLIGLPYFSLAQSQEKETAYAVLIDNTLSMRKEFPQVVLLGQEVIARVDGRGPIAVFTFKPKPGGGEFALYDAQDAREGRGYDRTIAAVSAEWSQDAKILGQQVDALFLVRGHTDLFGAIQLMAETIVARVGGVNDISTEKIIVLITDGEHRMEGLDGSQENTRYERKIQEKRLIRQLRESGIKVYAIGLVRHLNAYSGSMPGSTTRQLAEEFLKRITKETGGKLALVAKKGIDIDGLFNRLDLP